MSKPTCLLSHDDDDEDDNDDADDADDIDNNENDYQPDTTHYSIFLILNSFVFCKYLPMLPRHFDG